MSYTVNGIEEIKKGNYENAFSILNKAYFEQGETQAACYLAQMYYDERITKRTNESLASAMLLWYVTREQVPSSAHKLGVSLFSVSEQAKATGLEHIKSAAQRDYPVSFCVLGVLAYHSGDYAQATEYFSKYTGIEKDKKALLMYADALCKKNNPDITKAEQIYTICAEEYADSSAYRELSEIYLTPQFLNHKKSFEFMSKAAELGDIQAAEKVGLAYYMGNEFNPNNPPKDYAKAYKYLTVARKNNMGEATAFLGEMYAYGNYVQVDEAKAMQLYDDSIRLGYTNAYNLKGMACLTDDKKMAYECLKKAYEKGDKNYVSFLFMCAYDLYADDMEKKKELFLYALECAKKGVNLSESMHLVLGNAFYEGVFVDQDINLAVSHLQKCIDNPQACYIVGKMAAYGQVSAITPAQSESYLLNATSAGISDAMLTLGKLYNEWDLAAKAVNMLMKAYSKGEKEAALIISDMYLNGDVTGRKDKKKAAEWKAKGK